MDRYAGLEALEAACTAVQQHNTSMYSTQRWHVQQDL